jgi:hypothetical protein
MGYFSLVSSAQWLGTLAASAISGSIGVVGVLTGSWLTARRDDTRQTREIEREHDRWDREDERRWVERRRRVYAQYLEAVKPWLHHVRHWTGPYWDPDTTTKESLQNEEGVFDCKPISNNLSALESELTLIGSRNVVRGARWLHGQLIAFEAIQIARGLSEITTMGKHCENAHDWLVWAFRTDLGVSTPEPAVKPPPSKGDLSKLGPDTDEPSLDPQPSV